jgi:hypothetical protein
MSDQSPPAPDDSLPNPSPDETARLMREGGHSKLPWWKRLLPPWVFSIGLHLFVLPFVLGITVIFADQFCLPETMDWLSHQSNDDEGSSWQIDLEREYPVVEIREVTVAEENQGAGSSPRRKPAEAHPRPPRARSLLNTGIELLRKHDLELALAFFEGAMEDADDLTSAEREQLTAQLLTADWAVERQRLSNAAIDEAETAAMAGRGQEAIPVLKGLLNCPGLLNSHARYRTSNLLDELESPAELDIRGEFRDTATVVSKFEFRMRLTVETAEGKELIFECGDNTKLFRDDPWLTLREFDKLPRGTPLRIRGSGDKEGRYVARAVFVCPPPFLE